MPLAVTCQCGSRLEIDEKFLGKEILCPDCQRPLPTKGPTTPPPLEMPLHKRTSGLAIVSLTSSLVGMFTLVGSAAGIVLGVVALRRIAKSATKLEGTGLARAGIITGAVGIVITLALFFFPILGLGADEYLRWLAYASRTQTVNGEIKSDAAFGANITIKVSQGWRLWKDVGTPNQAQPPFQADDIIAVNIPQNAFIACQKADLDPVNDDSAEARQEKALERFYKSELINILGRLGANAFNGEKGEIVGKPTEINRANEQEFYVDMRLGGQMRRFLIRWKAQSDVRLIILVGEAPRSRFDRVEADIKKTFDSVQIK